MVYKAMVIRTISIMSANYNTLTIIPEAIVNPR